MILLMKFMILFLQRYQRGLQESMKGSEFIFDDVELLHYKR